MLLQDRYDFFLRIAFALHFETSLVHNYREIPHPTWLELRGYGHGYVYGSGFSIQRDGVCRLNLELARRVAQLAMDSTGWFDAKETKPLAAR